MRTRIVVALLVAAGAVLVPVRMAWSAPETRLELLDSAGEAGGEPVAFPTTHLALTWSGEDDAAVQVRWRTDGGWQPWQDAAVAHDLEDADAGVVYSGLVLAPGALRVQTRVVRGVAEDVKVAALDTGNGPRRLVRAAAPASAQTSVEPDGPPPPPVVTRAQWGADESLRTGTPRFAPVTKLIVHHTVTPNDDPDPAATIRAMYAFHTQVRGWDDIGYNFLVDARGRVYEGRYARAYGAGEVPTGENEARHGVIGAHAEGTNTGSAGVALLGDFTTVAPSAAAVTALEGWLAWKAARHRIDPLASSPFTSPDGTSTRVFANVAGHRDVRATECPGDRLYARLPAIRQRVAELVAAVRVPRGYWFAGADGAVHTHGAATSLGDLRGAGLKAPVRGMALTPTQKGYWLLGGDGGIFAFGDAAFYGSTGALRLNKPVVGMAPTPTGRGYWLVASDGGIFAFGDAAFRGSTGAIALNSPIVAMERTGAGDGYWLIARDGGVFAFGAPFRGSVPGLKLPSYAGSAALRATASALGYYVLGADGGVFAFGTAPFFGATPGLAGGSAAVDLAVLDVPA